MADSNNAPEDKEASSGKEDNSQYGWVTAIDSPEEFLNFSIDQRLKPSRKDKLKLDAIQEGLPVLEESLQSGSLDEAARVANKLQELSKELAGKDEFDDVYHIKLQNLLNDVEEKVRDGNISSPEKRRIIGEIRELQDRYSLPTVEDPTRESVEEYIEKLEQKEKTIERQRSQLQEIEKRLQDKEKKLEQVFKEVSDRKEKIEETQVEAEELENTLSRLVQWEAGDAIGGQFEKRKQELNKSLTFWLKGSLVSIGILLAFSLGLYFDISSGDSQGTTILSKATLLLPASVVVWFFVTNYSRQKQLMREYEFKESMAISFRGFLEMLREDMSEEERPQIGEFVVNTMDRIYSNPQENLSQPQQSSNQNQNQGQTGPLSQGAVAQILNRLGKR